MRGFPYRILGLAIFLGSANLGADAMESAGEVRERMRAALSTVGLTETDLEFKKDVLPDANLSPLVRTLLGKPLKTPEFVEKLEAELAGEPWERREAAGAKDRCQVADWKNTPTVLRSLIQELLDALLAERRRFGVLLTDVSVESKQRALRAFAAENFHVDRDKESFKTWAARTGGAVLLRDLVDRADSLDLGETELILPQLRAGKDLNPVELARESRRLLDAIQHFVNWQRVFEPLNDQRNDFDRIEIESSLGRVVLGGKGSQKYETGAALIIDLGGDDTYERAGCADGIAGLPFSVVIDLDGNDRHRDAGSGICGVGVAWDQSGDDRYETAHASLGCGLFGVGILVDVAGNDRYSSDTLSQGAAAFGYGLLLDCAGDDRYAVALLGQGYAGVNGYGVLCDWRGNDRYFAGGKYPDYDRHPDRTLSLSQGFSMGSRPFAPGGLGVLFDGAGDDRYECDIFGQGTSYWYSCGVLIDRGGNDSYKAYQYAQGTGIHLSVGILKDNGGNDAYFCRQGLAQAGCHDFAVGLLWDGGGNDSYRAESSSQGSGINNAVGILYDAAGDDRYSVRDVKNGQGQGSGGVAPRRGIGSVGVLLDMAGRDRYSNQQWDEHVAERPEIGVAVDVSDRAQLHRVAESSLETATSGASPARGEIAHAKIRRSGGAILASENFGFGRLQTARAAKVPQSDDEIERRGGDAVLGRLLLHAARAGDAPWKVADREKARAVLEALPPDELPGMLPWLGRADSMIGAVVDAVIQKQGKAALPFLRDAVKNDLPEIRVECLYWLGEKGVAADAQWIYPSLNDKRTRPAALVALSKLGVAGREGEVLPFLAGERGLERALAVRILARSKALDLERLVMLLDDPDWNVRAEVVKALRLRGPEAAREMERWLPRLGPLGRRWAGKVKP